ncbi:MAG: transporter substrate-binding domain-containing protein [Burkholderiales bacterium]|jgi:ABC-type amino acid transport substrate-binding protein
MTHRQCWISIFAFLFCGFATTGLARTLAEVNAINTISMCANPDALPYSSNQPDSPGIQVELGRAIAEGLGLQLGIEWIVPRRRAKVVNCDMLLDRVNDPDVYEGRLLLSRPYHRSGMAIGLGRDAQPLTDYTELEKGQKIGVMISSMASVVLGKAGKTTSPYAFESDMIEDLLKGELYGIATSSTMISYYIASNPGKGLSIAYAFDSVPSLTWQVSVGLRNSDAALLSQINVVLEELLADGTVTRIYQNYGIEHRQP